MTSAVLFALICFEPLTAAYMPNTESFINCFMAIGWLAFLNIDASKRAWKLIVLAGACAAWASMYKHVALAPAMLLAAAHVVVPPTAVTRRLAILHIAAFTGVIFIAWCALAGWFVITDRGEIFRQSMIDYPRFYAGGIVANLTRSFSSSALENAPLLMLAPVVGLIFFGGAARLLQRVELSIVERRSPRFIVMLIAMIVGAHIAVALPGKFMGYYYQLWYPVLAVAGGVATANILQARLKPRWLGGAAVCVAIAAVVAPQLPWYFDRATPWPQRRHGKLFMDAHADMQSFARSIKLDDDLFLFTDEPWLYIAAGRRAKYAGLYQSHLTEGPLAMRLTRTSLHQLMSHPPKYIVFWVEPAPADHAIVKWALDHYDPVPNTPTYPLRFYERRD
jgi:hypothetical protein